jgi:hypothetical protein
MDNHISGLKKRKRAQGKADQNISDYTKQTSSDYFDTSYWDSGDAKKVFVSLVGESVSDCRVRRIDSL